MEQHPGELLALWGLKDPPERQAVVKAYRKRAQRLHPDRAGNTPAAHANFIQLREQYELLLRYSSDPSHFSPSYYSQAKPQPEDHGTSSSPSSPDVVQARPQRAWIIPPGNITLRRFWPLSKVWQGGELDIHYLRGYPCSCWDGCQFCHGSLMRFEEVGAQVGIPPLNAPSTKVRILGMGHRGDTGVSGAVILELVWIGRSGWKWNGQSLFREVSFSRTAPWVYCRSPSGQWYRVHHTHQNISWVSPAGLPAKIQFNKAPRWACLGQLWASLCWGMSQKGPLMKRIALAQKALFQVW